jgi:hypothetical protein
MIPTTFNRWTEGKVMGLKLSMFGLLTHLALNWSSAQVSPSHNGSAPTTGDLFLDPSSTAIPGGKASLTIGVLVRKAETYIGDYQFKVSPYFFKNEKGKLSIDVSDATLKILARGMTVDFSGQATTSGSGKTRRINGNATPSDHNQGTVNLRFIAGKREMLFKTSYHFDETREQPH